MDLTIRKANNQSTKSIQSKHTCKYVYYLLLLLILEEMSVRYWGTMHVDDFHFYKVIFLNCTFTQVRLLLLQNCLWVHERMNHTWMVISTMLAEKHWLKQLYRIQLYNTETLQQTAFFPKNSPKKLLIVLRGLSGPRTWRGVLLFYWKETSQFIYSFFLNVRFHSCEHHK